MKIAQIKKIFRDAEASLIVGLSNYAATLNRTKKIEELEAKIKILVNDKEKAQAVIAGLREIRKEAIHVTPEEILYLFQKLIMKGKVSKREFLWMQSDPIGQKLLALGEHHQLFKLKSGVKR